MERSRSALNWLLVGSLVLAASFVGCANKEEAAKTPVSETSSTAKPSADGTTAPPSSAGKRTVDEAKGMANDP